MTDLTYDPDHVARGVSRLIERYRKPRTSALLASWLDEVQQAEDALWQLLVERWVTTAVGVQLDVLGRIVGEPRRNRDDDTYRIWISARNMVTRSSGKTTEILAIARTLAGPIVDIALEEYYPAAFLVRLSGTFTLDEGYQIAYQLKQAKPAGVLFGMTWAAAADTFRFAPGDTPVASSPRGFDSGPFAVVADGSFIPDVSPETLPEGTLAINGVPLAIGGVPLVISPPTAAAAAPAPALLERPRPIVARPVRIVPHAPAPAALVPVPLTGEFIELVDAFDDASLEMNELGDKFRVAESVQLAIAEHDEALVTLGAEVSAMRFPFTLRVTSVDGLSHEEIGILRLDATPFGAEFEFVAEIEVSALGQTAEVQLVNLDTAEVVATLTSTSVTTDKQTAAVTLPLSEQLYSVRLRRIAGDSSQRVSCRSAAFER